MKGDVSVEMKAGAGVMHLSPHQVMPRIVRNYQKIQKANKNVSLSEENMALPMDPSSLGL